MSRLPGLDSLQGRRRVAATLALNVLLAAAYFFAGKLGLSVATINPSVTTVWAPAGIALGAFLLWGYRAWPGIVLGAFLVNIATTGSAATALGIALGNTLAAVLGAYLVNRFARGTQAFSRLSDSLKFILLAGLLSTIVAATLGVAALALGGLATSGRLAALWLTWWVGDAAGVLMFAPLLVLWLAAPPMLWTRWRVLEAFAIAICALLVNLTVFRGLFATVFNSQPLEVLCIVPVLWAGFRLGARAPLVVAFASSRIAVWGTLNGYGPFLAGDVAESLVLAQVYSGILTMLALMLIALNIERRRADATQEQLLRSAQEARAQAEDSADKIARLQDVTAALSQALSASQVAATILKQGLRAMGADAGMIVLLDESSAELVLLGTEGYASGTDVTFSRFALAADIPLAEAVRSGRMLTLESMAERQARYPQLASLMRADRFAAVVCLPLSIEQRTLGGLALSFRADHHFTPADLHLMDSLAQLSAQALERTRLYESEQAARADAETARERLHLLAEAGSVLASSLDYRATLAQVAHLLVPRHGDWCALHIISEDGTPQQLEVAHSDPAKLPLVEELNRRFPTDPLVPGGLQHVIEQASSEYMSEVPQTFLLATARDAEHERLLSALGLISYMIVPLVARDKVLGAISLATAESGRHYDAADVALIEELAQRAALAIDNARLYGEARQTNAELEARVQKRTAQLQAANALLETEISERTRAQAVLQESEERFRLLIEGVSDYAIYTLDPVGRVMSWNEGAQRIKGYTSEDVLGRNFSIFYLPEDAATGLPARLLQRAARDGKAEDEGWRMRKDGSIFWAEVVITALRDAHGQLRGFSNVTRDSTEQKHAAEALLRVNEELEQRVGARTAELQEANRRLGDGIDDLMERNRAVGQLSEMGTLLQGCLDADEAYRVISQFGPRLFPLDSGALYLFTVSRDLLEPVAAWGDAGLAQQVFVPNDCWALRRGHMHVVQDPAAGPVCGHVSGPGVRYACVPLSAQGETMGVLHLRRGVGGLGPHPVSEAEQHLMGAMVEQAALALANLRLRAILRVQSIRDPLTGLFNRRYMEETLEREIHHAARQRHSIGIALLDIDRFKQFNDRFGHQVGDIVLRAVGDFLNANVRGEDIACRYGGEEFLLILQEASLADTRRRAEQLRTDIKSAVAEHYRERFGPLSVSIGIAVFPEHGITIERLVRAADSALYRAKAGGRDCVVESSLDDA